MLLRRNSVRFPIILIVTVIITACSRANEQAALSIAAAASLANPLSEIGEEFTSETGIEVTFTFASTGHLAQQIRNGAPYDVFASADVSNIDRLIEDGFLEAQSRIAFAQGSLVLVFEPGYSLPVEIPSGLQKSDIKRIVIANPEHAPYGLAAKQFLINTNLWQTTEEKLVFSENVRQAAQVVLAGNATVGIIATSTATGVQTRIIPIDINYHEPISHLAARSEDSSMVDEASRFLDYLFTQNSIDIFHSYGLIAWEPE
jgi:molybdate transport system substrate-binding protein